MHTRARKNIRTDIIVIMLIQSRIVEQNRLLQTHELTAVKLYTYSTRDEHERCNVHIIIF